MAEKRTADEGLAGILFAAGGLLFLLLTTAAESIYPDFSMQNNAISDLAAIGVRTTAVEEGALFALAICWIAGAYFLFRHTGRSRLMIVNILPGVGALLAGLSPENFNITIHSVGALLAFVPGAIVVLLSYRMIRGPFRYFPVALGAVSPFATFIIFFGYRIIGPCGTCGYQQSLDNLGLGLGGWESMIVYPLLVWLIAFGGYLMAKSKEGLH
jgi:hypothetical membrane protein